MLGVTGGIAAAKASHLARLLAAEADVQVVMTRAARRFVTPLTFSAVTGRRALTDMFEDAGTGPVTHVTVAARADLFVVAPATADFLARAAQGRADDLLGAMLLVTRAPVVVAPAMNTRMWDHPATQRNLLALRGLGRVHFVGPAEGDLACGWQGPGRMSEPEEIAAFALGLLRAPRDLEGVRVIVTAGPTEEPIDPVRVITNRSSGRMGLSIAAEAASRGASVTLVRGPIPIPIPDPPGVEVVPVRTAAEMRAEVEGRLGEADVLFMAAAVSDWRPRSVSRGKIRKEDSGGSLSIDLVKNPDILAECASLRKGRRPLLVGFSLETDPARAVRSARAKLSRKGCDVVVSNLASENLGTDSGAVTIVRPGVRAVKVGPAPKSDLARAIVDAALPSRG